MDADKKSWEADKTKAAALTTSAKAAEAKAKDADAAFEKDKADRRAKLGEAQQAIAKKLKEDQAAADKEKGDSDAKYAAQFKTNGEKYAAEKAKLHEEAEAAKANFAAETKKRNDADAKEKAAKKIAKAAHAKQVKADHDAEEAHRTKEGKAKKAIANEADKVFDADMGKADGLKKIAKAAEDKAKAYNAAKAQEQKDADDDAAKEAAEDADMKSCDDGKCMDEHNECHAVQDWGDKTAKFWMGCHGVSCRTLTQGICPHNKDPDYDNRLAGIEDRKPFKQFPKETKTCKDNKEAFHKAAKALGAKDEGMPAIAVGCVETKDEKGLTEKKEAMDKFFEVMKTCNPWCIPHSEEFEDDGKGGKYQTTHGVCTTAEANGRAQEDFEKIKNDKHMGTNDRFKANPKLQGEDICTMAKASFAGFLNGGK